MAENILRTLNSTKRNERGTENVLRQWRQRRHMNSWLIETQLSCRLRSVHCFQAHKMRTEAKHIHSAHTQKQVRSGRDGERGA